jgi:ubiquinol-cytochrome c reductase iron-sulfur subunit
MRGILAGVLFALLLSACDPGASPLSSTDAGPKAPDVGDVKHFHACAAEPAQSTARDYCIATELKKHCTLASDCLLSCMASKDGNAVGGGCEHVCFSGLHPASEMPKGAFAACDRVRLPVSREVDVSLMEAGERWVVLTNEVPVWILSRTPEQMEALLRADATEFVSPRSERPAGVSTEIRPELFLLYANCPGTNEILHYLEADGFRCDSSGQRYDLAGRPLPYGTRVQGLSIPNFSFKNDDVLVVPADRAAPAPPPEAASATTSIAP